MRTTLSVLLLMAAVACLAAPLTAAEPAAPGCSDKVASALDLTHPDTVSMVGLEAAGEPCGGVICPPKMECCNPTCNKCVFPGMRCTQEVCNSTEPASEPVLLLEPIEPEPELCGLVICPKGTTCCNPLCSACTPPGVSCTLGDCGHGPTS